MMSDHNYNNQDLTNKVNMYLDNALSREKSFRKLIKNNVPRRKVSKDVIQGIMRKISTD